METTDESIIVELVTSRVKVKSIILIGSRAVGEMAPDSDFDILLVMGSISTILNLSKIKRIERELAARLKAPVSLNPLPNYRIKRSLGNLFLFKVKHEGKVLFGENILPDIKTGDITEIPGDKTLSFLFSLVRELASISPIHFPEYWCESNSSKLKYMEKKCLTNIIQYVGLIAGRYETAKEATLYSGAPSTEHRLLDTDSYKRITKNLHPDNLTNINSLKSNWFICQQLLTKCCLEYFQCFEYTLSEKRINELLLESIDEYAIQNKTGVKVRLKNLEYYLLALFIQKSLIWRGIFSKGSIQKRIRAAMLLSLMSSNEDGTINKKYIMRSKQYATPYLPSRFSEYSIDEYLLSLGRQMILSETLLGI